MVRANLEATLELNLPSPATTAKADYSADCGICYGYRLQKQEQQPGNGAGAAGGGAGSGSGGAKAGLYFHAEGRRAKDFPA